MPAILRTDRLKRSMQHWMIWLFILLFLYPFNLNAANKLDWIKIDQIPFYIAQGEYKGQGLIDNIIRLIQKEVLTDFSIQDLWVNHKRFNIEVTRGNNCYLGWKTFPSYRLFSNPALILFPMGIITHRRNEKKFGPVGSLLSLKKQLENTHLKIGLVRKFAYTPAIQKLVQTYQKSSNIYFEEGEIQIDLRMIANKRIDYTLGWPMQPIVSKKLLNIPNQFIYYNIEEDQRYVYGGVSCSKTDTGRLVIERFNRLLKREDIQKKMIQYMEEWAYLSKQWRQLYQLTVIEGQKSPLVVHMEYGD